MKTASQQNISGKEGIVLATGFIGLTIAILFNTRPPFYDEVYYLENVALLKKYGPGKEYLTHLIGSAGPMYSVVHYILQPITKLRPPLLRMVNLLFLSGAIFFLGRTIARIKYAGSTFSGYVMAIPMTYVIAGLALTEMPAIFFLSAAFYFLIRASEERMSLINSVLSTLLAGACMSLAILGRQTYLLALVAFPIPLLGKQFLSRRILLSSLAIISSLLLPAYVFYTWNGFVAPGDAEFYQHIKEQGISFAPQYVVLCLSYFALLFALLSPAVFVKPGRKLWAILMTTFFVAGIANYFTRWVIYLPLKPYTGKIFSSEAQILSAEIFCGTILITLAGYMILSLLIQLRRKNFEKEFLFYFVALIMIAVSCVKITYGFSSRYAAQAIPMILPVAALFYKPAKYNWVRAVAGILLGLLSLGSFIFQEYLK